MYFESPVYLDDGYVLLTPETPVTELLIKNLGTWGFTSLFTEDLTLTAGNHPSQRRSDCQHPDGNTGSEY